jgi:hypothetical protein
MLLTLGQHLHCCLTKPMLNRISSGWLWLEKALNALIDEINRQKPLPSATIAVEESPNGTLLKLISTQQTQPGTDPTDPTPWKITPDGETADWHSVRSFDPQTMSITQHWVWGGTPQPITTVWLSVILVDPATCAQSSATFLEKPTT